MNAALAQRLRHAADAHREGRSHVRELDFAALLTLHGDASLAVLLLLMALVCALPIVGSGTLLSVGICVAAWAWARGNDSPTLPKRVGSIKLSEKWSGHSLEGLAMMYEQCNLWMRPRLSLWSHPRTRAVWGLWIALMAFVIFLPLPFGNVLPSVSLILLSLGWMSRDGLVLMLGIFFGVVAMAYGVVLWQVVVFGLTNMWNLLAGGLAL